LSKCVPAVLLAGLSTLGLHIAAHACGLIDDSHADLEARNVYVNRDNRSGTANPCRHAEWGQGFVDENKLIVSYKFALL
jgi:hypothetical protein